MGLRALRATGLRRALRGDDIAITIAELEGGGAQRGGSGQRP
jgi:hypothetical protein